MCTFAENPNHAVTYLWQEIKLYQFLFGFINYIRKSEKLLKTQTVGGLS